MSRTVSYVEFAACFCLGRRSLSFSSDRLDGGSWKVDFYDARTGSDIVSSIAVLRDGDQVTIPLPDFTDDIAFKMYVH